MRAFATLARNDLWLATHLNRPLLHPLLLHHDRDMTPPLSLLAAPLFPSTLLHVFHAELWHLGLERSQSERHNLTVGHRMEIRRGRCFLAAEGLVHEVPERGILWIHRDQSNPQVLTPNKPGRIKSLSRKSREAQINTRNIGAYAPIPASPIQGPWLR